jgi:glycosyltransferase involved in cell wall biosynthesis
MKPLISVIIPTHGRPQMLAEALVSVRSQTYSDFEIIVVSNGANSEARSLTRSFARSHDARYFELHTGNLSIARNFGIEQAHGDWIAFLDDDDLWLPQKLEQQVSEAARTGADLIGCRYLMVGPDGRAITCRNRLPDGWTYTKALSYHYCGPLPSGTMVRKAAIKAVGGFDPRLRFCPDWDILRRISWRHSIHVMDEVLVLYRVGHLAISHPQNDRRRRIHELKHFAKMWLDTPRDLRSELPRAATFVPERLVRALAPGWLLGFLHRLQPRTRLNRFRYRLRNLRS